MQSKGSDAGKTVGSRVKEIRQSGGGTLEAFESFVALAMEGEGLLTSGPHMFSVRRQTRKVSIKEFQTHGYEVDLIGIRKDKLVLASVKSLFGSGGVFADRVTGKSATHSSQYKLINDVQLREEIARQAARRFGFQVAEVELRLYAGKFASAKNEAEIRDWCRSQFVGSGPIGIFGAKEIVPLVLQEARRTQYRDSEVLATLKVLDSLSLLGTPDGL